jgi:pyridoxal biosynthesis lyase PdxS
MSSGLIGEGGGGNTRAGMDVGTGKSPGPGNETADGGVAMTVLDGGTGYGVGVPGVFVGVGVSQKSSASETGTTITAMTEITANNDIKIMANFLLNINFKQGSNVVPKDK